ncbi:MAG: hypothetical protein GX610_22270 [Rhodococcus sp.]|nr:hypothetical protein [Rhodococcus sp. (in: high G+C Gram-positive bacteria)]
MTAVRFDDSERVLSRAAVDDLLRLLESKSWMLEEWLTAATSQSYRAPDDVVPHLLDAAMTDRRHRARLLALAGAHGQQLAAHKPEWAILCTGSGADHDAWRHGTHTERLEWLTVARTLDPVDAVRHLEREWDAETGEHRADFLTALNLGTGPADENLLERALDDSVKAVRERAVQLLRRLPNSQFASRMADRARTWIRVETKPLRKRLVIRIPGSLDSSARRDGIEDVHFKNKGIRAWWLRMVVAATPLSVWEDMTGSAAAALEMPIEQRWRSVMLEAWRGATVSQRNGGWAEAFLAREGRQLSRRIASLVPRRTLDDYVSSGSADRYLLGVDGLALLEGLGHPWPLRVARRVVAQLEQVAARQARSGRPLGAFSPQNHHTVLRSAETHFPLSAAGLLTEAAHGAADSDWQNAFASAASAIERRRASLSNLGIAGTDVRRAVSPR